MARNGFRDRRIQPLCHPSIEATSVAGQASGPWQDSAVSIAYRKGLHELGDGLFAYLQPDGTWGWSNAGLIAADGTSLLVDTLFDLELTRAMLEAMRPVTDTRHSCSS